MNHLDHNLEPSHFVLQPSPHNSTGASATTLGLLLFRAVISSTLPESDSLTDQIQNLIYHSRLCKLTSCGILPLIESSHCVELYSIAIDCDVNLFGGGWVLYKPVDVSVCGLGCGAQ